MKEIVLRFVYEAIDTANVTLEENQKIEKKPETKLYGAGSHVDSIVFVNILEEVEKRLEEFFQQRIILVDERKMQNANSPFSTIDTFVDFIDTIITERVKRHNYKRNER